MREQYGVLKSDAVSLSDHDANSKIDVTIGSDVNKKSYKQKFSFHLENGGLKVGYMQLSDKCSESREVDNIGVGNSDLFFRRCCKEDLAPHKNLYYNSQELVSNQHGDYPSSIISHVPNEHIFLSPADRKFRICR